MWDRAKYVFGVELEKNGKVLYPRTFEDFQERHCRLLGKVDDPGAQAMLRFVEHCTPQTPFAVPGYEDALAGGFLVFRLEDERGFLHERPAIIQAWLKEYAALGSKTLGQCLVTGVDQVPIARVHPQMKGILGAQPAGASLIGFTIESFGSLGKKQGANAPVSEAAAFGYTTALNHMLRKGSTQKVQIGDAATVFWTERPCPVAEAMADILTWGFTDLEAEPSEKEQERLPPHSAALLKDLRHFFAAVRKGRQPHSLADGGNPFFILGLAPNAARIAIRFWHVSTVQTMAERIALHFSQLALVKNFDKEPDCPSLWALLKETAAQGDTKNIPPLLGGQLASAVFTGSRYPQSLFNLLMTRIRADKNINYLRAALLKAWLVRNRNKEIPVALDKNKTDTPYLLGRLFALYERAQELAIPQANATIKDRFYGAAAATPARVFVTLEKNCANHLAKLRKDEKTKGTSHWLQIQLSEIIDVLTEFPSTLDTEDQAEFILGYYQQRKDLFTKHTPEQEEA